MKITLTDASGQRVTLRGKTAERYVIIKAAADAAGMPFEEMSARIRARLTEMSSGAR